MQKEIKPTQEVPVGIDSGKDGWSDGSKERGVRIPTALIRMLMG